MDPAAYDTNSLHLNDISSIAYSIYELATELSPHSPPTTPLQIESELRANGHIVYHDHSKGQYWHFEVIEKDKKDDAAKNSVPADLQSSLFNLVDTGSIDPSSLHKGLVQPPVAPNAPPTPSSAGLNIDGASRHSIPTKPDSPDEILAPKQPRIDARVPAATPLQITAYEYFIAAVLLTISTRLAAATGGLLLNYRTLLLKSQLSPSGKASRNRASTLCTLKAYLTTAGSLVVNIDAEGCPGLSDSHDHVGFGSPSPGSPILTAPFGVLAIDAPYDAGSASLAPTPITHTLSTRGNNDHYDAAWKRTCKKVLQLRGVDAELLDRCTWSHIAVPTRPNDFTSTSLLPWPSPLCLRKRMLPFAPSSRLEQEVLKSHTEQHDPLGQAKSWFMASHDREEMMAAEKAVRQASGVKEEPNGGAAARIIKTGSDLRRPSTIAASPMYPTPPDGVHPPQGITPSLDGNISSPRDAPSAAAGLDLDTEMSEMTSDSKGTEVFDQDKWDANDPVKRERSESNILTDADNVFGDMGGDMFGENDVTEDDFNFFDEAPTPNGNSLTAATHDTSAADGGVSDHEMVHCEVSEPKDYAEVGIIPQVPENRLTSSKSSEAVFAKPELKHARSSLQSDAEIRAREKTSRPTSAKRENSPFTAETVYKRVRAFLDSTPTRDSQSVSGRRRSSAFGALTLDPSLPLLDKKYRPGGVYAFDKMQEQERRRSISDLSAIPEIGAAVKRWPIASDVQDSTGGLLRRFTALDTGSAVRNGHKVTDSASEDASSGDSDSDESSFTTEDATSPPRIGGKKAKTDDEVASQAFSTKEVEGTDDADALTPFQLPQLVRPEKPDVLIGRFLQDPDPVGLDPAVPDEDMIQLAQILTDQAASGSLNVSHAHHDALGTSDADWQGDRMIDETRSVLQLVQKTQIPFLQRAIHAKLKDLVEVQDAAVTGQPSRLQPRIIPGREPYDTMRAVNFYPLPMPHLEVRRADNKLSVLNTATTFWESLGLGPVHGPKDVISACVFPRWAGVTDSISDSMARLGNVFELLKLGTFELLDIPGSQPGHLPYETDRISTSSTTAGLPNLSPMIDAMEPLRSCAKDWTFSEKNIVLCFVYSTQHPVSVVEACAAFQNFFEYYRKTLQLRRDAPSNELVLQLVPLDMISSPTTLVQTTPQSLKRQCMELYDRCVAFGQAMPSPAITLEQPVPRHVNFECSPKASASLVHEHSCMHVAYAQSVDERWVSAAWTDDRGCQQSTASYCLGRKGKPLSNSMNEIAHEIWETTMDLIATYKVQWRVIIAKCGPMDADEIKFWVDLARTQDRNKARASLTILSVDSRPSLQLLPAVAKIPQSATALGATPESTPQASVFSPDQVPTPATPARDATAGAASTPGNEPGTESDADNSLIDVREQTWAALAGHRLGTAPSVLELQPALFSGWLIKRTGPSLDEPPAVLEVNLVHSDHLPRQYEASMREVLSWYRTLGTLARARGVTEEAGDVRPWHIAAAEKAVRTLYLLL